jgi:hypothetical protein
MKTTLLILFLSMGWMSSHAQFEYQYTTNDKPPLKNDGKRIPVSPAFSEPYTVVSDPACYMYKTQKGLPVLECPGVLFTSSDAPVLSAVNPELQKENSLSGDNANAGVISLRDSRSFTGNYPKACRRAPHMPANAVPAWPESHYTPLQDPACPPCYKYKSKKSGITIMECPYGNFPSE